MQLEQREMLTTLIILLAGPDAGVVLIVSDGVVSINGQVTEFEQDNKPDYLGYHLSDDFNGWYSKQVILDVFHWQDISISTDGISSFSALEGGETDIHPISYLLSDTGLLEKKLKYLEHQAGLKPTDDLAIITVRNSRDNLPAG